MTKNMKDALGLFDRNKFYALAEAVAILQKSSKARKFDESLEIAMNLNIDPRHADQQVRGVISLPHGTGATVRVAVFAKDDKAQEAQDAGADIVGADDLIEKINAGEVDFDRAIATPDMMALVGRVAKVLGPKGLMPNPKLGTVTPDVAKAVKDAKGGAIEFRAEKAGIIHAGVGKMSFDAKKLEENALAFIDAIQKARPTGAKGSYIDKITLTSTMGPGIKLDLDALNEKAKAA